MSTIETIAAFIGIFCLIASPALAIAAVVNAVAGDPLLQRATLCPQCASDEVVQCRYTGDYCENCGWPDENRQD